MSTTSSRDQGTDFQTPALPVGDFDLEKFDPSIVPASAEEYLHKVMWEAKQCKEVVTVDLAQQEIRNIPVVKMQRKMKSPSEFLPSREIQMEYLKQFSLLRDKIERCRASKNIPSPPLKLPKKKQEEEWCALCLGSDFQKSVFKGEGKRMEDSTLPVEGTQPLLSILLNIPIVTLENLVEWHANWLEMAGFSDLQGRWLFAIFACVEKPLTPELCSILRNVLQNCAVVRAALDSSEHPHLVHLNMLITIVAKYFNQDDLADP